MSLAKSLAGLFPMNLTMASVDLKREVEAIRRYIITVNTAIKTEFEATETRLREMPVASEDEDQRRGEDMAEAYEHFVNHFPQFAMQTTFVATYSLLEDALFEIARMTGQNMHLTIEPKDLASRGGYIQQARTYLQKACGVVVPDDATWKTARIHGEIRNAIAHERGKVDTENKPLRDFIAKNKAIKLVRDRVELSTKFCLEALDNTEKLLVNVHAIARARCKQVGEAAEKK